MKRCPECYSEILTESKVCPYCTIRIEGKKCKKCASFCKEEAHICAWCGNKLDNKLSLNNNFESFEISSEILPTILFRATFLPQRAVFSNEKITITTPQAFGLSYKTEEVFWSNITGFQLHSGLFWDSLSIETKGQSTNNLYALSKKNSKKILEIFRSMRF